MKKYYNSKLGGWFKEPTKRWHHDASKWNRGNIDMILVRNPALASALELLGITAGELAAKAEERENRRRPYEERANMLAAHATPDRRVGPAQSTKEQINRGGGERPPFSLCEAPKEPTERKRAKRPIKEELVELMKDARNWADVGDNSTTPITVERSCSMGGTIPRQLAGLTTVHVGQAEVPLSREGVCVEQRLSDLELAARTIGKLTLREDEVVGPSE